MSHNIKELTWSKKPLTNTKYVREMSRNAKNHNRYINSKEWNRDEKYC